MFLLSRRIYSTGYSVNLQVTSANLPAKHLIHKVWIFSERSTQTTHVDVSAFHSLRHTMAIPPTTSSSNHSPRLAVSQSGRLITSVRKGVMYSPGPFQLLRPLNEVASPIQHMDTVKQLNPTYCISIHGLVAILHVVLVIC
jgi:hypothetical protein